MGRIKRNFIFFIFLISSFYSFGQIRTDVPKSELDSLIKMIPDFHDEELVDHLNLIATSISQRYPDSCFYYANQASELSDSIQYEFGKVVAVFNVGNGYYYKIEVKNALINYLTALNLFENFEPCLEYGNLLMQIGSLFRFLENDSRAIEYYRKAKVVFDKIGNRLSGVVATYKIGYSFIRSEQFDSALIVLHSALTDCKKLGNLKHLAIIYDYLGITYEWRDDLIPEKDRKGGYQAIHYLDSCYYFACLTNFDLYKEISLSNIGECYHHYIYPPDYQKAEEFYLKALNVKLGAQKFRNRASTLAWLGEMYADIGNYPLSKLYLDRSLQEITRFTKQKKDTIISFQYDRIYTDINYSWWTKSFIYTGFMQLYQYLGEYDKAIEYSELRFRSLDSLKQLNTRSQIDYILATAENERTKQQIQLLEKEKELQQNKALRSIQILAGLVIVSVIMGFLLLIYLRQNKLKAEQEKTGLQQKLLRTQMNPHFLFNSLASIQNFIIKEKPALASDYLSRFSKLVRQILNNSVEEWVLLEDEIESIENYLELQKVRHRELFEYTIEVDEAIDPETIQIPPMLAQPFIENSIEHGFKHKEEMGNMSIKFKLIGNQIRFEMEDDGVGRDKAKEIQQQQNEEHRSMSTEITRERLQVLNKKTRQKINLSIIDLKDEQGNPVGTKVTFDIPYKR